MAIVIPIIAEFKDKGLSDAKKGFKEAESSFEKAASAASSLAKPAAAVVSGMAAAGAKVAKEAYGAQRANETLASSLKAVGYPETTKANLAYADSLAMTIGVQDEEIKATMNMLTAFDATASSSDMMARTVTAGADMAAKGFGTMESSSKMLGKALADPVKGINALFRAGVTFTDQQKEQIKTMQEAGDMAGAQAIIMGEVERTFGGAAAASASMGDQIKIAFGEVAEALGVFLLPMLAKLAPMLMDVAKWMNDNAKVMMIAAGAVTALSAAIVLINIGFKLYAVGVKAATLVTAGWNAATKAASAITKAYHAVMKMLTVAMKASAAASKIAAVAVKAFGIAMKLASGPIGLIVAAVVALAVVIVKNWDAIKDATIKVWNYVTDFITKAWNKIKVVTMSVWNSIKSFLTGIWNSIKSMASSVFQAIENLVRKAWDVIKRILSLNPFIAVIKHSEWLQKVIRNAFDWVKSKIDAVWNWIKRVFAGNPFTAINGALNSLKGWISNAFDAVKNKISNVWNWIKGVFSGNPFTGIQGALNSMKGWFSDTFGWIKRQIDSFLGVVNRMVDSVQAAFNKAKNIADKIPGLGKKGKSAPLTAVSPYLVLPTVAAAGVPAPRATAVRQDSGGGGVTITVNGALDPEGVARQIRGLLDSHDRRQGRAVIRAVAF